MPDVIAPSITTQPGNATVKVGETASFTIAASGTDLTYQWPVSYTHLDVYKRQEWYRVENTHEAIISEEVFQKVQELIASRRRRQKNGTTQIFYGLVKCAD